ncbi:VacJ family lipoprotein [Novosphingobium sp. FSY-8]|uniref:VacJ family lipoprotein n=1 Tax=Novosphingobium ovatum TaxID=1908523 RepID=A0ABW9XH33_9SPHN|nr:VacJ family lipoprotein [Novosphingobium ovatum]NBC37855.1 VacJ family lipoprotein [Novosphingobium ovatum]
MAGVLTLPLMSVGLMTGAPAPADMPHPTSTPPPALVAALVAALPTDGPVSAPDRAGLVAAIRASSALHPPHTRTDYAEWTEPQLAPAAVPPEAQVEAAETAPAAPEAAPPPVSPPDTGFEGQPDEGAEADNPDPFEGMNRLFWAINQPIDRFIIRPIAMVYKALLPEPVRDGIHNMLANIYVPGVLANDILQLRPRRALNTLGRFAINSTIGIGGMLDMARRKPFKMVGHPNGFSDTLGYYGLPDGAYLYLPVMGPSTVRDILGLVGDAFTQPLLIDRVSYTRVRQLPRNRQISSVSTVMELSTFGATVLVVDGLDQRARADGDLRTLLRGSVDPYAALRSSYLQSRAGEVAMLKAKHGEAPALPGGLDDPLEDPAPPAPAEPAPAPVAQ